MPESVDEEGRAGGGSPEASVVEARLARLIANFDAAQIRQIANIAEAMHTPVVESIAPASDLVGPHFSQEIKARLQAHHGTHTKAMDRISWEDAFAAASRQEGRKVGQEPSATNRFWDVEVDGQHIALKSTKEKKLSRTLIRISKLCEAAFLQDCRSARMRYDGTQALFAAYLRQVDRIMYVRVLPDVDSWVYELVEIPVDYFRRVSGLDVSDFQSDGPRIAVLDDLGNVLFRLVLDRSDQKITITSLPAAACTLHATWTLPKQHDIDEGDDE